MKNLYVTEMRPNGTRDLIVSDRDGQILDSISEAIFGGRLSPFDNLNGCYGLINGESVGYFEYSHEAYGTDDDGEDILLDEPFVDLLVENGEYQGVELVYCVNKKFVSEHIAVSPVNDGNDVVNILTKHFGKI